VVLKLSVQNELLLDSRLIFYYKNGLLKGEDIYGILVSTIIAPLWEEILFRGIILFTLLKYVKPFIAIPIVAVIWAFSHPMYWVITLISGVLLGIMTYKTKSITPSIITHSTWNLYTSKLFLYF
jgi:uncharacterized protein